MFSQDLFSQSQLNRNKTALDLLRNAEEKKKLKEEIDDWKSLRAKINKSLEYYKNSRPFPDKSCIHDEKNLSQNLQTVPDVIETWKDELYRYSGMYCVKYDQDVEYTFEFISSKKNSKKETYFVQILEVEGKGKLGLWRMPMLLDVNEILSQHPIDDIRRVKSFVKLCKHYLACQENRETQFEDLMAHIQELHMCSVQANREIYTCIQLQMFKLREIETDKYYDIILYIIYESNECRPSKLIIDSLHEEPLPEDIIKKLRNFFKNFKISELKPAFEEIVEEQNNNIFQWEKALKDLDIENEEEENGRFSQGDADELSSEKEEENIESSQDHDESKKLKKSNVKVGKNKKRKAKNSQNGVPNIGSEEHIEKEKSNSGERTGSNLKEAKETKKGVRLNKVNKTALGGKENGIERKKKKVPESKVTKKSGNQTKLDFLRYTNIEKAGNSSSHTKGSNRIENNEETGVNEDKSQSNNQENDQSKNSRLQKSPPKQITRKNEKETENIEATSTKEPRRKDKKKRSQLRDDSVKKTFDLSNFVLRKKTRNFSKTGSSSSATLLKPISLDGISNSSTPIPGRKQPYLPIGTEISEIIKVNKPVNEIIGVDKPIRKSPEKRPRNSSDSELEDIVEEPDQSLLKNLEEFKEKTLNVENENRKEKKSSKRTMKFNKRARKL